VVYYSNTDDTEASGRLMENFYDAIGRGWVLVSVLSCLGPSPCRSPARLPPKYSTQQKIQGINIENYLENDEIFIYFYFLVFFTILS